MYKLDLEKTEELEIELPTSVGSENPAAGGWLGV